MIQRIQSIYLSLTFLLSLLFLKVSILTFLESSGSVLRITFNGLIRDNSLQNHELIEKLIPLSVILILISAISLVTIFLFKKRKLQLLFSGMLIAMICIFILISGYYTYITITRYNAAIVPDFKMALPFVILVFSVLAQRGIKKDDRLIKSYDRLR